MEEVVGGNLPGAGETVSVARCSRKLLEEVVGGNLPGAWETG